MECPDSVLRPVLTYRFKGKTIFPRGLFTGVYFSEELKAVLPIGYKILKIHSAKQFDKSDLFTGYVNQMYHTKNPLLTALPPERRATLVATAEPGGYRFDVRLQGEGETVFLAH